MGATDVTVVIKSLGLGGAERLLVDSLPYLDRAQFRYRFAYITPWKDTLVPAIAAEGFAVTCLGARSGVAQEARGRAGRAPNGFAPARSLQALTLLPAALARLEETMRRTDCRLLQADLPAAGIVARIAGRRTGVPVAYTEHNLQERYHPATRWANRATYAWNDVVFAVSGEVASSIRRNGLAGRGDVDVRTLPNGVPVERMRAEAVDLPGLQRELGLAPGQPVVGTVAVFRAQKRLLDWLEVARRVAAAHPDVAFLLVGDGPAMPAVQRRVRELGLEARVRLPGFREDGRRLMALIGVYLMTSEFEGLPVAMLEAMAFGKPVVATAVGGIPEVISAGEEGLLAPMGDVELLAAQVNALLSNPSAAEGMGERGRAKVSRRYHTRRRVEAMESAYGELLARERGRQTPAATAPTS